MSYYLNPTFGARGYSAGLPSYAPRPMTRSYLDSFESFQDPYPLQPYRPTPPPLSRVERLRAELELAELEAAAAERQRRFEEIKEEERLRVLARQQVLKEVEEEARLEAALARHREIRQSSLAAEQAEARRKALYEAALQEERLRLRPPTSPNRLTVEHDVKNLDLLLKNQNQVHRNSSGCLFGPTLPVAPHKDLVQQADAAASKRTTVQNKENRASRPTLAKASTSQPTKPAASQPYLVVDFEDIFQELGKRAQEEAKKESKAAGKKRAVDADGEVKRSSPASSSIPIKVTSSLETRPDLQGLDTASRSEPIASSSSLSLEVPDVKGSLEAIRKVAREFQTLVSTFTFPDEIDFPPSSSAVNNEPSSPISLLAFTPHNAPLRSFENTASKFLNQLDAVESYGDDEVRKERKQVVETIEQKMAEIERELSAKLHPKKVEDDQIVVSEEKAEESQESTTSQLLQSLIVEPEPSSHAESESQPTSSSIEPPQAPKESETDSADVDSFPTEEPSTSVSAAQESQVPDVSDVASLESTPTTTVIPSTEAPSLSDSTDKDDNSGLEKTLTLSKPESNEETRVEDGGLFLASLVTPPEEKKVRKSDGEESDWSEVEA